VVYDLNQRSEQLLVEHGKWSPFINRVDPFLHRLMGACVGASIELACNARDIEYIARHQILSRNGNQLALPLSRFAAQKSLVPDELFGIRFGDTVRFFAVEIDRNSESIGRRRIAQNTFGKKLINYLDAMRNRAYKEEWGIPNMMVLTVTTNVTHMQNMMAYLQKLDLKLSERFLFKALLSFGSNWRVPPVLKMLEPWKQANGTLAISNPY